MAMGYLEEKKSEHAKLLIKIGSSTLNISKNNILLELVINAC